MSKRKTIFFWRLPYWKKSFSRHIIFKKLPCLITSPAISVCKWQLNRTYQTRRWWAPKWGGAAWRSRLSTPEPHFPQGHWPLRRKREEHWDTEPSTGGLRLRGGTGRDSGRPASAHGCAWLSWAPPQYSHILNCHSTAKYGTATVQFSHIVNCHSTIQQLTQLNKAKAISAKLWFWFSWPLFDLGWSCLVLIDLGWSG